MTTAELDTDDDVSARPTIRGWQRRLGELMKLYGTSNFAQKIGFSTRTIRGWLDEEHPHLPRRENVELIAKRLGGDYPLEDQLRDLGWIPAGLTAPLATALQLQSSRLLMNQLSMTVNKLSAAHIGLLDLIRELLESCDRDEPRVPGRWTCRIFDVASGLAYPHAMFRGVEFQLTPGNAPWRAQQWEDIRDDPLRWNGLGAPWIEKRINSPDGSEDFRDLALPFDPSHSTGGSIVTKDLAWERLELMWRMRRVLPLVQGSWLGHVGHQYRKLLVDPENPTWRHIYLGQPYQERAPDPGDRARNPAGDSRIMLVGPGALRLDLIAAILGDGLGYPSSTARHLAEQWTGQVHQYQSPERAAAFAHVWHDIESTDSMDKTIISVYDLDALMTPDGDALTDAAKAMLTASHVFPVLLAATPRTLRAWQDRQIDRQFPYECADLGGANDPEIAKRALNHTYQYLQIYHTARKEHARQRDTARRWRAWGVREDLPWWPAELQRIADPGLAFTRPEIGDYLIRVAYAIAGNLVMKDKIDNTRLHGSGSTAQASRPALHLAEHSLLWTERHKLNKDKHVDGLLAGAQQPAHWKHFNDYG